MRSPHSLSLKRCMRVSATISKNTDNVGACIVQLKTQSIMSQSGEKRSFEEDVVEEEATQSLTEGDPYSKIKAWTAAAKKEQTDAEKATKDMPAPKKKAKAKPAGPWDKYKVTEATSPTKDTLATTDDKSGSSSSSSSSSGSAGRTITVETKVTVEDKTD